MTATARLFAADAGAPAADAWLPLNQGSVEVSPIKGGHKVKWRVGADTETESTLTVTLPADGREGEFCYDGAIGKLNFSAPEVSSVSTGEINMDSDFEMEGTVKTTGKVPQAGSIQKALIIAGLMKVTTYGDRSTTVHAENKSDIRALAKAAIAKAFPTTDDAE